MRLFRLVFFDGEMLKIRSPFDRLLSDHKIIVKNLNRTFISIRYKFASTVVLRYRVEQRGTTRVNCVNLAPTN